MAAAKDQTSGYSGFSSLGASVLRDQIDQSYQVAYHCHASFWTGLDVGICLATMLSNMLSMIEGATPEIDFFVCKHSKKGGGVQRLFSNFKDGGFPQKILKTRSFFLCFVRF